LLLVTVSAQPEGKAEFLAPRVQQSFSFRHLMMRVSYHRSLPLHVSRLGRGLLAAALIACGMHAKSQGRTSNAEAPSYSFSMPVDEVSLTFHASGADGRAVTDLKLADLSIYDNLKRPSRILAFELLHDAPIRAGILLDTSESMDPFIARERTIAQNYVDQFLRPPGDDAFIMNFGYVSKITQPWTSDRSALALGIRASSAGSANPLGGTSLFDTVFGACLYQFGKSERPASGNFIVLFTDGEDNSSHVDLKSTVDACQRSNTAIYAFRPRESETSSGPKNLELLTSQTGGRVFSLHGADPEMESDLRAMEADQRNRYWLVYKPAELKHDGHFHEIYVGAPERNDHITIDVRTGYYAPGP
jgi:Ca-activated chloride channel homolog